MVERAATYNALLSVAIFMARRLEGRHRDRETGHWIRDSRATNEESRDGSHDQRLSVRGHFSRGEKSESEVRSLNDSDE